MKIFFLYIICVLLLSFSLLHSAQNVLRSKTLQSLKILQKTCGGLPKDPAIQPHIASIHAHSIKLVYSKNNDDIPKIPITLCGGMGAFLVSHAHLGKLTHTGHWIDGIIGMYNFFPATVCGIVGGMSGYAVASGVTELIQMRRNLQVKKNLLALENMRIKPHEIQSNQLASVQTIDLFERMERDIKKLPDDSDFRPLIIGYERANTSLVELQK